MQGARSGLRERIFGVRNIHIHIQYCRDGVRFWVYFSSSWIPVHFVLRDLCTIQCGGHMAMIPRLSGMDLGGFHV
jgi:hypothetical protein